MDRGVCVWEISISLSGSSDIYLPNTAIQSHTVCEAVMQVAHFFFAVTMVQGNNFTFPSEQSLLTPSAIKQCVPGVRQLVFLGVLKAWYYLGEGGSARSVVFDIHPEFTVLRREQEINKVLGFYFTQ